MINRYLTYIFLILSIQNVFGNNGVHTIQKIFKPEPPQREKVITKGGLDKLPKEFKENNFKEKKNYSNNVNNTSPIRYIAEHLWRDNINNACSFNYTKKYLFGSNQDYIIIKFSIGSPSYYIFEWKKKFYSSNPVSSLAISGLEEFLAEYYKVDYNTNVQFLYPYKESSSDEPWAIKINNEIHVFLWKKAIIENCNEPSKVDSFLYVKPEDEKAANYYLLINENNQILAKKINNRLSYNHKNM